VGGRNGDGNGDDSPAASSGPFSNSTHLSRACDEVLFGCSVYVVIEDSATAVKTGGGGGGRRGASQFAVALLTRAPVMELLLERLRSVVPVFVRAQFQASFSGGGLSGDGPSTQLSNHAFILAGGSSGGGIDDGVSEAGAAVLRALHASVSSARVPKKNKV
jgi:hypothetical protein